ncbi:DHS-like NAD/FAD-binding domain-containing protein [Chaetomium strumarium]|uniref:DHS-like NAD/FAD-binding domain-containing protein n=1 Tax=Chaetomium strumarium TaxID=1170767 RepID=A0AAJ0GRZ5_9PEZI|nr:DHS-like NAD/FAD-binding domain-containing protein [Chaetomium strumarium]
MIHVEPQSYDYLDAIAHALRCARKVVVLTGAGISTAAGIPDYRSRGGLYAEHDTFCAAALRDPRRRADSFRSALHLYKLAKDSKPTEAHTFVTQLRNVGKLLRCYTQNVDQLHERAGLSTGLVENVKCVPLHGTIDSLRCSNCCKTLAWTEKLQARVTVGQEIPCPGCLDAPRRPGAPPRRSSTIGRLRPNIVYLEEEHPQGEDIAELINRDVSAGPDTVLIFGTSFEVSGPWDLVKRFAKVAGANGGKVIYVNRTKASRQGWKHVFDYWVEWECDSWVQDLMSRGLGPLPTQRLSLTLGGRVAKRPRGRQRRKAEDEPGSSFSNPILLS